MSERICISDMTLDALTAYIVGLGQPKFRAKQIFKWLHQKLVTEFSQMTDQPKTLLAALEEQCTIAAPSIRRRQQSKDGTVKYLLQLADGNCIETVLMRYKYGNTVCVSTQVGCAMGCRFCASTQAGRVRDLTAGEIASEIYTAQKDSGERVSHIVNGHRGATAQFQQCDGLFGDHLLPGGCQHRHAQHQPVHLRPGAENRRAGKAASAINAVRFAARAG